MKTEDLKKHAVWLVPLGLAVICLIAFLASRAGSKPEEPEDVPRESVTKQVEEVEATSMHLRKKEGQLGITDGDGKDCPPRDNLGLYSGYHLLTQLSSYAWIGLDDVKLAKMDENSEMGIRKEGKDLTLFLSAGGVFFNVTEPLPEDETLNIRCSSMGIGIRGTCGWVQMTEDKHVLVYLLEGNVECKVTDGAGEVTVVTVSAGEVGDLYVTPEGAAEVEVVPFAENYVAPFVMDELTADPELSALVLEVAGLDVLNPPDPVERLRAEYQEVIDGRTLHNWATEGLGYAVLCDLDQDGTDELILGTKTVGNWGHGLNDDDPDYGPTENCPITQLEVYGDKQGHAAKLDEVIFTKSDAGYYPFEHISLREKQNQPYIFLDSGSDLFESVTSYSLVNGSLVIGDKLSFTGENWEQDEAIAEQYSYYTDGVKNICPKSPADDGYETAFLKILDVNGDWDEPPSYAKLIDMNHDGVEDLLYDDGNGGPNYSVCLWNGSEVERVNLFDNDNVELIGGNEHEYRLYREKSTGDIYLCYFVSQGTTAGSDQWFFQSLKDSAEYYMDHFSMPYAYGLTDDEYEDFVAETIANDPQMIEMNTRFEFIEKLPRLDDYEAGYATVSQTIDQLLNQIREKYPS